MTLDIAKETILKAMSRKMCVYTKYEVCFILTVQTFISDLWQQLTANRTLFAAESCLTFADVSNNCADTGSMDTRAGITICKQSIVYICTEDRNPDIIDWWHYFNDAF